MLKMDNLKYVLRNNKSFALPLLAFIILFSNVSFCQIASDFGFKHLRYEFKGDTIEVLIKSKIGEADKVKPLFFSVQGSLAVPLIIHNGTHRTRFTTLEEGLVEDDYHLVIVNKPGVPLIAHQDSLVDGKEYFIDKENYIYSENYLKNNHLEYYVERNLMVIDSLLNKPWVDTSKLIISGHSQGSGIALSMCVKSSKPTHLIYSGGNPYFSTILAMLSKERLKEDSIENPRVKKIYSVWKEILNEPHSYFHPNRDSNKTLYSFSIQKENEMLKQLKIPVLVSYGTKDESCAYNDMFQLEVIKENINKIEFKPYVGLDHNYMSHYNTETDYINIVVNDWLEWLEEE